MSLLLAAHSNPNKYFQETSNTHLFLHPVPSKEVQFSIVSPIVPGLSLLPPKGHVANCFSHQMLTPKSVCARIALLGLRAARPGQAPGAAEAPAVRVGRPLPHSSCEKRPKSNFSPRPGRPGPAPPQMAKGPRGRVSSRLPPRVTETRPGLSKPH